MDAFTAIRAHVARIPVKDRPFGHIVVRSDNPFDLPVERYWGLIKLDDRAYESEYFFTVDNFDLDRKTYKLSLFLDQEMDVCILEVHINFTNEDPLNIDMHNTRRWGRRCKKLTFIAPELISITHLLVYKSLKELQPTGDYSKDGPNGQALLTTGYVLGISDSLASYFSLKTEVQLWVLISSLDLVFH